ncbi:prominin-1-like [Haemaphysalis longicornis]
MGKHCEDIFKTVGLPTPSQLDSLQEFLSQVKQECSGDATCTNNADKAENARAAILKEIGTIFQDFGASFNQTLIEFYLGQLIQNEIRNLDSGDQQRIKTLKFLQSAVEGTRYPKVTSMGLLGRMSPFDWLFSFGENLGTAASTAAIMMELVTAVSFTLGILNHDREVPPTKRNFVSNQSGIMLVVCTLFMWIFCILMMLSSLLFMMGGVISRKYICEPYKLEQFGFIDNIVLTLFLPRVDDGSETFHQAEFNAKALELYNTTLNPTQVFVMCGKNKTLLDVTKLTDIKGSEASFLAGNPPKYLKYLRDNRAFLAKNLVADDWDVLTGTHLQDLAEPVLALRDSLTTDTGKLPINNIDAAKVYAKSWQKGRDALFNSWLKMKANLALEMNRDHLVYVNGKVGNLILSLDTIHERFKQILGSCWQVAAAYRRCFNIFCDAVLPNLNGVWFALWLVCLCFCGTIVFILKVSRYLMRMDDYMYEGIEVEESIVSPEDDKTSGLSISYEPRMGMEASDIDLMRWQADRLKEFMPDKMEVEVKRVRDIRQRLGLLPNQPLPIGGQSPNRAMGRGGPLGASAPRGPAPGAK